MVCTQNSGIGTRSFRYKEEARKAQASLDVLRDETNELLKTARNFQTALTSTFSSLGLKTTAPAGQTANGDLSFPFNMHEVAEGSLKEAAELQQLTSYLNDAVLPVQEMGKLLNMQTTLFSDIPSLWPIKGGIGHISMALGKTGTLLPGSGIFIKVSTFPPIVRETPSLQLPTVRLLP